MEENTETYWDKQGQRKLEDPKITYAEAERVKAWVTENKNQERSRITDQVARESHDLKEMENRLKDDTREAIKRLKKLVEDGKSRRLSYRDYDREMQEVERLFSDIEKREQSLRAGVERLESIATDPHGYADSIFRKYPTLAEKRPRLVDDNFTK